MKTLDYLKMITTSLNCKDEQLLIYNEILEKAVGGIAKLDTKGNYVETNEYFEGLHGYSRGELIGKSWKTTCHADDHDKALQCQQIMLAYGTSSGEFRSNRKDGSTFWKEGTLVRSEDASGVFDGFYIFSKDISARKRLETRLIEREEVFRSCFEYARIGMALVDKMGIFIKVNKALCNLVGYTETEMLTLDFQTITHPDDLEVDLRYVDDMLKKRRDTYEMEKRYIHKDGSIIPIRLSVSLVDNVNGQPLFFVAQIQDLSELHELRKKN